MQIYNSETHKKEEFKPIEEGKVRMYVCGPTVYDQIHIGNGRTFLAFDVIRRYLLYKGYQVTFAQNLTDVDDKIIKRAKEEGTTPEEVAAKYSAAFIEQMNRMNVIAPDVRPRATAEIDAMQEMIQGLINNDCAYVADNGDVYFSVRNCDTYGEVSGRNIDTHLVGARIEENTDKRDPLDFALWKAAKPGEIAWESPWGKGRPGWHTECSAMVHRYLGCPIDIHGGGADLIFPHHENEEAQVRCCWHTKIANLWMHSGMLRVDGEKMSKSVGNFYTLKEVLDKYPSDAVRLLMLQTHYRSPLDFSFERLEGSVGTLKRLQEVVKNLMWVVDNAIKNNITSTGKTGMMPVIPEGATLSPAQELSHAIEVCKEDFVSSMDDDFNTSAALAAIFSLATSANTYLSESGEGASASLALRTKDALCELLGVLGMESFQDIKLDNGELPHELVDLARDVASYSGDNIDEAVKALIDTRAKARSDKNWAVADAIRDGISALGLVVEDTSAGCRIKLQ